MRKNTLFLFFAFLVCNLSAQTMVDVADLSFRLEGITGEKILYYGFCEGDKVIVSFSEKNGNTLKEFEIMELPGNVIFQDFKTTKIENKNLNISKSGIYQFRLTNTAISGRTCNLIIKRIPATPETQNFNTAVYWKTERDTTYIPKEEKFIITKDTSFQEVYSSTVQISSQNALNGNRNTELINFQLPENTNAWSFYIGVGNDAEMNYHLAVEELFKGAANIISSIDPLAAVAISGVPIIIKNQGADNVKYCFLDNQNAELFNYGQPYRSYKVGDIVSETSQMKFPLTGNVYLAMINDNSFEPISVFIKVEAVQIKTEWGTREIKEMNITEHEVPYLTN